MRKVSFRDLVVRDFFRNGSVVRKLRFGMYDSIRNGGGWHHEPYSGRRHSGRLNDPAVTLKMIRTITSWLQASLMQQE